MEEIKCIFCDKENEKVAFEENGYKARRCADCGLIYVSPRPTFDEIQNLYADDKQSAEGHIQSSIDRRLYARHSIGIIKNFIKSGSMLEIGAGGGYFLDEARKAGFEVFANEFNIFKADFIRNTLNIPCEESPFDNSIFNGKKFDIIYHRNVVSHFYDPANEFRKINERLNDNGFLVFETGNMPEVEQKYYKYFKKFNLPQHLFFFGENNIRELLKKSGFKLIKIYRFSLMPQFIFIEVVKKARIFIRQKNKNDKVAKNNKGENVPGSNINNYKGLKKLRINLYSYLLYFSRYRIGSIAIKKGRPQTVIVIAQKMGS